VNISEVQKRLKGWWRVIESEELIVSNQGVRRNGWRVDPGMNLHINVKNSGGGKKVILRDEEGVETETDIQEAQRVLRVGGRNAFIWRNNHPWDEATIEDGDNFHWEHCSEREVDLERSVLYMEADQTPIWTTTGDASRRIQSFRYIHQARARILKNGEIRGGGVESGPPRYNCPKSEK
jgi:hypothetical protein